MTTLGKVTSLGETGVLAGFDSDAAGQRAAVRAYPLLRLHTDRINMVAFPPGQDAAQILDEHGPRVLAVMLASRVVPLADMVIDARVARWEPGLGFAEGRIGALRAVAPVIAGLAPRDVPRQVARLAGRLELDHATVTEAVTDGLAALIHAELAAGFVRRRPARQAAATRTCTRCGPCAAGPADRT